MIDSDSTRLNVERARAALARARMENTSMEVRSPRPVDLSQLSELDARRDKLEQRTRNFRTHIRTRLGLPNANDGQHALTESLGSAAMDGAMCDGDFCAPRSPDLVNTLELTGKHAALADPPPAPARFEAKPDKKKRKKFLGLF